MNNLNTLFETLQITPKKIDYYVTALTHSSVNGDLHTRHRDYEQLEFMGDSVLGFVVAELGFSLRPELNQGELTKMRAQLVQTKTLALHARSIKLYDYIKVGASITQRGELISDRILDDVFEALIGAIYFDLGFEVVRSILHRFFRQQIKDFSFDLAPDYKSDLQVLMQSEHREQLVYELVREEGPSHNHVFHVAVRFNDIVLGEGSGKTKKAAEQEAAKKALEKAAR